MTIGEERTGKTGGDMTIGAIRGWLGIISGVATVSQQVFVKGGVAIKANPVLGDKVAGYRLKGQGHSDYDYRDCRDQNGDNATRKELKCRHVNLPFDQSNKGFFFL